MMFRPLFVIVIFMFFLQSNAGETVHIAVINLEPFLKDEGEGKPPGGIAVDYWRNYIAPRMNVTVQFSGPYPIKRAELMLKNGEVDAVMHLTKIADREKDFHFPQTHLTEISSCLVVTKQSRLVSVTNTEDLYDRSIVFISSAFIPEMLLHKRITIIKVTGTDFRQLQLNMLFAGRVDSMLDINHVSLVYYLRNRGYSDRVRVIPLPVPKQKVYTIFTKTSKGHKLSDAFDKANRPGLKAGVFERLTREYMSKRENADE
ncbi:MAG: transporter substrate-binding domain-containing protein [Spirochaetes bacterium]|jgi:ABC-type amino acid transport substrate-binding protein|nr:transporter substrate-binding domain-containing protein [Spirochaetota bacterium]